jgi:electron transport complex protein RnfD
MPAMQFQAVAPPHVIAGFTVPRVMFQVLLALVPFAVVHVWLFGPAVLLQLGVAAGAALGCEALALRLRGRPVPQFLRDGSVLVTAALLAVSVPPLLPWWLTAFGTAVAVLLGMARRRLLGRQGSLRRNMSAPRPPARQHPP